MHLTINNMVKAFRVVYNRWYKEESGSKNKPTFLAPQNDRGHRSEGEGCVLSVSVIGVKPKGEKIVG